MEAAGGLASPKNATIFVVASCCSIKLISYLAYFTSSGFLSFLPAKEILLFLEYRLLGFFPGITKFLLVLFLETRQIPLPRVLLDVLAGKVKSLKRATF